MHIFVCFLGCSLGWSGLSGVSDIVGEVLAQGSVDPGDLGLSHREAQRLVNRAL